MAFQYGIFGGYNGFGGAAWQVAQQVEAPVTDKPVKPNEPVKRQNWLHGINYGGVGSLGTFPGYVAPPPMNDATARVMSMHSTLAFVFANIVQPIAAAGYTVEINQDIVGKVGQDELDKRKKVIEAAFKPLIHPGIRAACRALQYGRWTQQVIFDRVDGFTVPVQIRSFLPWEVQLMRDPYGVFAGVRYMGAGNDIDARYLYHHVNCPELDPIFGFTRHWNVREEWWQKFQNAIQLAKLAQKASSIVPIVKGPQGTQTDADGKSITGQKIAENLAAALGRGEPVYMPQYIIDDDAMVDARNPDLAKFTAFDIDTVDLGEQGAAMSALHAQMTYEDVCFSRGWHQPERASMEGSHGTKAEAGVHKAGGIEDAESVMGDAFDSLNAGPVNQTLVTNWGPGAKGSIFIKPQQLQDASQVFKQQAAIAILTDPNTGPDAQLELDGRALLRDAKCPRRSEGS